MKYCKIKSNINKNYNILLNNLIYNIDTETSKLYSNLKFKIKIKWAMYCYISDDYVADNHVFFFHFEF